MRYMLAVLLLTLPMQAQGSEVIPPRIVVKCLVKAVQEKKDSAVRSYFTFNENKHSTLTSLSRDEQIQLLKDIPLDKLQFDKDEYATDEGQRFLVKAVSPVKLDFEIEREELKGELGPPYAYRVIAIRKALGATLTIENVSAQDFKSSLLVASGDGSSRQFIGFSSDKAYLENRAPGPNVDRIAVQWVYTKDLDERFVKDLQERLGHKVETDGKWITAIDGTKLGPKHLSPPDAGDRAYAQRLPQDVAQACIGFLDKGGTIKPSPHAARRIGSYTVVAVTYKGGPSESDRCVVYSLKDKRVIGECVWYNQP